MISSRLRYLSARKLYEFFNLFHGGLDLSAVALPRILGFPSQNPTLRFALAPSGALVADGEEAAGVAVSLLLGVLCLIGGAGARNVDREEAEGEPIRRRG